MTTGAFFDSDSGSAAPTVGSATLTGTSVLGKAELEAQAAAMFAATPPEERRLAAPPTLEEMLVGGSEAAAMLGRLFTVQQQPHVVYPLSVAAVRDSPGKGGHRRCASTFLRGHCPLPRSTCVVDIPVHMQPRARRRRTGCYRGGSALDDQSPER